MNGSASRLLVIALAVAAVAACSHKEGSPGQDDAGQQAQAKPDPAARDLDTYRQLVRIHNDEMATTIGEGIVKHYPDSAAAKEVQKTLPDIARRYHENAEKNRLQGLWLYQVSPMQGGTQSTAVIYNSHPMSNDERVRLVLRRHTEWGQNAFLFGSGKGFACKGTCTLPATIDGKPTGVKAFAPPSGEPALMISNDKAFIATLEKAKKITLQVTRKDDGRKLDLVYEVGGFQPAKWLPLKKKK